MLHKKKKEEEEESIILYQGTLVHIYSCVHTAMYVWAAKNIYERHWGENINKRRKDAYKWMNECTSGFEKLFKHRGKEMKEFQRFFFTLKNWIK